MKSIALCLLALTSLFVNAQENEKKITVKPYGFVGFDAFVDSRQSATARGSGYFHPLNFAADELGADKNDRSSYDFVANISRFGFAVQGPDAFGASTSAKIEGDFAGTSGNGKDFVLRLRHAYLNLDWGTSALLVGQTWHPMFIPENYPATLNFVAGLPFHPLSRAPQFRYTYMPANKLSLSLIILSQGDFTNLGFVDQVERSDFPEAVVQVKYGSAKDLFMAATFGVKQEEPSHLGDKLTSMHGNLSLRYTAPAVTIKAEGVYGGNMTNLVMIGGLARKAENGTALNGEYEAIRTAAFWTDIHTNGETFKFGVFAGTTNNMGTANESIIVDTEKGYVRGGNIEKIYSISPRVVFTSGPVDIGVEINRTIAFYGANMDKKSKPIDSKEFANNRLLLSFRYHF